MPVNPTVECLSALSVILDLANGLAEDKSLLTAAFAVELAEAAGAPAEARSAAFFASLLRHLGCTAFASVEATLAGDDVGLRSRLLRADASRPLEVLAAVSRSGAPLAERGRGLLRVATQASTLRTEWAAEACGAARQLAHQLKLGPDVSRALDEVFERWDGRGAPHGLSRDGLSLVSRVAQVAHVAVVFHLAGGLPLAEQTLRARSGSALDPALVDLALPWLPGLARDDFLASSADATARAAGAVPPPTRVEDIAEAFGDFADLQGPFSRGHSRAVARVAGEAAQRLGLPEAERRDLRLAAHLHDVGQAAVPTGVWSVPRAFRPTERERARTHAFFTERVLASAAPLSAVAKIAGAHHERLDGSGYHRGLREPALSRPARVLAAADALCAMLETRPHRAALERAAASAQLRDMARRGELDADAAEACLGAVGDRRSQVAPSGPALTARELDVLRLLARGRTNKEIAQQLRISARTVQHHSIHIYGKLGVDTRAAAALHASRQGLLEPE
ncbi:MAG TPA: HD domain-containing phosphohydrolase [Myxococcales bacterium]|nr:HD domain-containing phosphohydrolase [Myxococcales bacterium]